jgi:hypothetical protein
MKGALVFLAVFAIFFLATYFGTAIIPPGAQIYGLLNVPNVTTWTLVVISVFNGVVYGVIVWIIYSVIAALTHKNKNQNINQTVNINVDKKP